MLLMFAYVVKYRYIVSILKYTFLFSDLKPVFAVERHAHLQKNHRNETKQKRFAS
jgi:hypothetical protein